MKAVMLSIQPKWCELIASGKKTVEVRKTRPKLEAPFKVYIYCTKPKNFFKISSVMYTSKEYLHLCDGKVSMGDGFDLYNKEYKTLNRKVIGEFVCDYIIGHCEMANADIAEQQGCIKREKLFEYANGKELYGLHISDLVIYDEPKMLHHFFKPCGNCDKKGTKRCTEELTDCRAKTITRPPQSWCYVEELK